MKLFDYEAPFWRFMSRVADLVIVNAYWLICSLPIVTIGASTSALYCVTLHMVRGEGGGVTRMFFSAFKQNLRQGLALFFILLLPVVLVVYEVWLYVSGAVEQTLWMSVVFCMPAILVALITGYVYPLLAQFDNSVKNTLKNACLLAVGNLPFSIVMALLNLSAPLLFLFATSFFIRTCVFWLLLGGAVIALINSYLLRRVFHRAFGLD
mgnify:CR=1 FL=1